MVDFAELQAIMKDRLVTDRSIRSIEAEGPTLEAAVTAASTLLNIPLRLVAYEVTEKGMLTFLIGKRKPWKIRAYERVGVKKERKSFLTGLTRHEGPRAAPKLVVKDGEVFVNLRSDGVFLKITPPENKGKPLTEAQAVDALHQRRIYSFDEALVQKTVMEAAGTYVKAASYDYNPMNSSTVSVELTDDKMQALVSVKPPGFGGADLTFEDFLKALHNAHVTSGIKEDFLHAFIERPVYHEKVCIAEGQPPLHGRDAAMVYEFEPDTSKVQFKEGIRGNVDFKDLNIIQNVVKEQPLAKKTPYEKGVFGRTVLGELIEARDGKDITIPVGRNCHIIEDGVTVVADINGQVIMVAGKINVEPIYTVEGSVDIKTGNVIFLGNVVVTGNVEEGFSVKAAGNIEVRGTVDKADLDAEGDIIVRQGITGKNDGLVRAGKSLMAKFITNAIVETGDMVIVSDGIINSQINAGKRILCQGKRASIVGGHLRAAEEINAKSIGSPTSGTETICEVGYDPESVRRLEEFEAKKQEMRAELDEVQLNLQTLLNIKKQRKSLPEEKEAYYQELTAQQGDLSAEIAGIEEEIASLRELMENMGARGKVSASARVYPGAEILIKGVKEAVRNEHNSVTFALAEGLIRSMAYEELDAETKRGMDGVTAD